ncbi:MAG: hypothetical protein PHC61_05105 [Chitinivibrionales bacterium]|nr:hypothetical protein [Chitinivibrionales bacterium]
MRISIISPNRSGCVSILDCGVTYLATYLNTRTTHRATIWDFTFRRKNWQKYLSDKFHGDSPDAIGITFTTLYEDYVRDTIAFIRGSLSKTIPIILAAFIPRSNPPLPLPWRA